jgi:cob(I)alamin adenosyltransferase
MKIYTKKGDSGMTSLFGGKKISKSDIRIEAYGTIDELNSYIGIIISNTEDIAIEKDLIRIQKRLFDLGAILATNPGKPELMMPFNTNSILFLENKIDEMEKELAPLRNFILPSGSLLISHTHVARTICRRAERRVVAIPDVKQNYKNLIIFLNRLSDYLFVLARKFAKDTGISENLWDNKD